jgi:hypothetical protein
MTQKRDKPFNSRTYQGQLEREVVIGGLLVGLVVASGLIYLLWGATVLWTALGCFVLFLALIGVVWLFLKVIEFAARD